MNENNMGTWELLAKTLIWEQLDFVQNKRVLDYGSGYGITSNYFAKDNEVVSIEPSKDMLSLRKMENTYKQIHGGIKELREMESGTFDVILCHNVLEYASEREAIVQEFYRLLKPEGVLSIVKHNRAGRVMQMVVLLNNFEHASQLLEGENGKSAQFGPIHYYEDLDVIKWCHGFTLKETKGIRTFYDLQQNQDIQKEKEWQEKMLRIERRVSDLKEYQDIAFFHHLLFTKKII